MQVREITVGAGRVFSHPYESFSNLRPWLEVTATIQEDEDWWTCTRTLQEHAEILVEEHKKNMLKALQKKESTLHTQHPRGHGLEHDHNEGCGVERQDEDEDYDDDGHDGVPF